MPLRRSPRLHPQIHASGNDVGMTRRNRRRRRKSPAAPESLQLNEDMLREILLRLPSQPSSLLRACAVCKHWRGLVTDPRFRRRFRAHQGKPPLLGVFELHNGDIKFKSTLDPPDHIPRGRFNLRSQTGSRGRINLLGCRHGRALLLDVERHMVIVCDPITGEHHRVAAPPVFRKVYYLYIYGAVICAAVDHGHVHGSCHSSPFKVVLMSLCGGGGRDEHDYEGYYGTRPIACVYSSETGIWGNLISMTDRCKLDDSNPGILVGNVLYWSSKSVSPNKTVLDLDGFTDNIVEFDLDRQSLAVIKGPTSLNGSLRHQVIRAENDALGVAIFSHGRFEVWQRMVHSHGGNTWLLQNAFELDTILGLPPQIEGSMRKMEILGYDEDNGAIFVFVDGNVYMVQLMSMQFGKLYESRFPINCHPFASFYAPGVAIPGGSNGLEILHDA